MGRWQVCVDCVHCTQYKFFYQFKTRAKSTRRNHIIRTTSNTHCWFMLMPIWKPIIKYMFTRFISVSFSQPIFVTYFFFPAGRNTTTHMQQCISSSLLFYFLLSFFSLSCGKEYTFQVMKWSFGFHFFWFLFDPPIAHSLNKMIIIIITAAASKWQHLHIDVIFNTFLLLT